MISHETRVRVRYAETDQMGVVYHSNYMVWMEVGRVELYRSLGLRYRDMERDGLLLAVAEINCRYISPAHYDDEVAIKASIEKVTTRMVCFGYEMRTVEDGRLLATGTTRHIFCDRTLKRTKLADKYQVAFGLA
jgi:acyl-CoA thioester hydrolase